MKYNTKAFFESSLCLRSHQLPEEENDLPQKHWSFVIVSAFTPEQKGGRGLFRKHRFRPGRKERGGERGRKEGRKLRKRKISTIFF